MGGFKAKLGIENFDEEAQFCIECTEDYWLKLKIRKHGTKTECSICKGKAKYAVSFETLAGWMESIWREWFQLGREQPKYDDHSDKVFYEQRGDDAELLISELVQCTVDDDNVIIALIEIMTRNDDYEIMDGGSALIDDCQLYQQCDLSREKVNQRWKSFVLDLKHHTRYFNKNAEEFFNTLFADLHEVSAPTTALPFSLEPQENKSVVQSYEPGSLIIFRARKAGSLENQLKIMTFPETELSNPPDRFAAEGRMNPKGISYFYGAEDRQTCVAELRPTLSEKAISAEFEVIAPVQLLDLTLLSHGRHKRADSMFDDDYLEKRIHRHLLRQLHWLIAQPVLNGDDFEYLPTQAMAEYLARLTTPRIDGVIFESVQRSGGRNIVLFPHVLNKENHSAVDLTNYTSAIKLKPNTLVLHELKKIEYAFEDQVIVDGEIENVFAIGYDDEDYL